MLWLAYAVMLIPLGVVCFLLWSLLVGEGGGDAVVAFLLGMEAAVAIAVGVAVTRYRLYEIDRLINRTSSTASSPARSVCCMQSSRPRGCRRRPRFYLGHGSHRPCGRGGLRAATSSSGCGGLALRPPPLRGAAARAGVHRRRPRGAARAGGRRSCARFGAADRAPNCSFGCLRATPTPIASGRAGGATMTRAVTKVEHRGQEIALLRHKRDLLDRPDLLRSVLACEPGD